VYLRLHYIQSLVKKGPTNGFIKSTPIITINVEGANDYQMVANDKISIEYPPSASDTIEVACSTGLPSGFICVFHYSNTYKTIITMIQNHDTKPTYIHEVLYRRATTSL
jgi:hypothetical protein